MDPRKTTRKKRSRGPHSLERREQEVPQSLPRLDFGTYICPLCGRVIAEMASAIGYGSEHSPAHLDCVRNLLLEQENLGEGEDLVYIGSGQFGVARRTPHFHVVRRIPVERRDLTPDWRQRMKDIALLGLQG